MNIVCSSVDGCLRTRSALLAVLMLIGMLFFPSMLLAQAPNDTQQDSKKILRIEPRYYRWHVDPGTEWIEKNTDYAKLDWSIPLDQTALVLVDVWDRHYLKDTQERAERVIEENLSPLLATCRQSGMTLIHAPSPKLAKQHPNWFGQGVDSAVAGQDDWPPAEFRGKSGPFKQFGRPIEPRASELARLRADLTFHPKTLPQGSEPVVATGEELHRLCKQSGIMFLFFAGFNTNACILTRDYGTVAMSRRGYEVILVRDCTTGMESCQSQPTLGQTEGAVLFLEMFGQYSVTSQEIRTGLK